MRKTSSILRAVTILTFDLAFGCANDGSGLTPIATTGGAGSGAIGSASSATGGAANVGGSTGAAATSGPLRGGASATIGGTSQGSVGRGGAAQSGAGQGGAAQSGAGQGGTAQGGAGQGGAGQGGTATTSTGGNPDGGKGPGGNATGGYATSSVPTGGFSAGGGTSKAGTAAGGSATGGNGSGGSAVGGSATGGNGLGGSSHSGSWRIAPLGDSITGTTCYPQLLSKLLIDEGRKNFTLVGSQLNNQICDGAANVQSEGHGGYWVTQLLPGGAHAGEATTWAAANQADIVLMHFATNDLWNGTLATQSILDAFSMVIDAYRAVRSKVIFLVAQIIPNAGCSTCGTSIPAFNADLVDWAAAETTNASPIYLVDQFTGFDPIADTGDGTHPNVKGSQKMAVRWAEALAEHGLL